jgi:hypothetical protein
MNSTDHRTQKKIAKKSKSEVCTIGIEEVELWKRTRAKMEARTVPDPGIDPMDPRNLNPTADPSNLDSSLAATAVSDQSVVSEKSVVSDQSVCKHDPVAIGESVSTL